MKKKIFTNQEEYREYLDEMFEDASKIESTQGKLKDSKQTERNEIELHIAICTDGFHVHQEHKTFVCQTGEQLVSYLKTMSIPKSQLLELHDLLLSECMKYEIDFPTNLI